MVSARKPPQHTGAHKSSERALIDTPAFLLAARLVPTSITESDARFRSYDFRAAHAAAEPDLQQLLDNNESLVGAPLSLFLRILCSLLSC